MNISRKVERNLRGLIIFIFVAPIYFYSAMVQAIYVDGGFTAWRWEGEPPLPTQQSRWVEISFRFSSIMFDDYDEIFSNGKKVRCNNQGCRFVLWIHSYSGIVVSPGVFFAPGGTLLASSYEANQWVRNSMPYEDSIRFKYDLNNNDRRCMFLHLETGSHTHILGSTCNGVLPPLPPTTPEPPPPPEPLSCAVAWQSSIEIDFGVVTAGESKAKGLAAKLVCQGGTSGKARLRFTDVNQIGADTVTLRKSGSSEEIKVKLSVGDANSSNEKIIDVSPGFNTTYAFIAKLDGTQLSGVDGGTFSGNALIVFEVI
ncbi:hypothetical protein ACUNGV_26220 [Serratia sp. IR-2025]|uniref:hypothetical protein n=2 Tax=Serratia TaxID=613 RepID=UPI0027D21FD5|nr:hypothetical protein [Serratia nevei]WMC74972.1 hypothetical protein O8I25_22495 [Serratia nevei]WMC80370.1 hypothetical protein O8I24_22730 [Serratia nevei]